MPESHSTAEPAVLFSIADGIAEIRFNRPKQLNAINPEMATALHDAVLRATSDRSARVIVLSGAGRAFMAGGDLSYFRAIGDQLPKVAQRLIEPINASIIRLAEAPQPVLASLNGPIAGAGMSLALAADLGIAADDAVFNLAYAKVGNSPDASGSWSLPRLVGLRKALEIALLSDNINAAEALRLSLVNWVVPADRLAQETRKVAERLAAAAPLALASIKRLLRESLDRTLPQQLDAEAESFTANAESADFREALNAFFEKRAPQFKGV